MPEWQADAIIISVRPHGEGNAVVSLLTADHGRHAYGRGRRIRLLVIAII